MEVINFIFPIRSLSDSQSVSFKVLGYQVIENKLLLKKIDFQLKINQYILNKKKTRSTYKRVIWCNFRISWFLSTLVIMAPMAAFSEFLALWWFGFVCLLMILCHSDAIVYRIQIRSAREPYVMNGIIVKILGQSSPRSFQWCGREQSYCNIYGKSFDSGLDLCPVFLYMVALKPWNAVGRRVG